MEALMFACHCCVFVSAAFIMLGLFYSLITLKSISEFFYGACSALFGFGFVFGLYLETMPTAMDVYKGRTILQVTYQDSVAVDSVVVFKAMEE